MHHFECIASPSPLLPMSEWWQEEYYSHYGARYLPFSLSIYAKPEQNSLQKCNYNAGPQLYQFPWIGICTTRRLQLSSRVFDAGPRKARRLSFKLTAQIPSNLPASLSRSRPDASQRQETGFPSVSCKWEERGVLR